MCKTRCLFANRSSSSLFKYCFEKNSTVNYICLTVRLIHLFSTELCYRTTNCLVLYNFSLYVFRNEDLRYLNESAVDSVCQKLSVVTELAEQLDFALSGLAQSTATHVLDDSSGNVTQVNV